MEHADYCKICLIDIGYLLQPCNCSGSIKYVHPICLMGWQIHKKRLKNVCEICLHQYNNEYNITIYILYYILLVYRIIGYNIGYINLKMKT